MCLGEFIRLDNIFGQSTLGIACCSCGKLVKLTGLGKIWPNYAASEQPGNFFLKRELLLSATKLNNNLICSCNTPVYRYFVIQANCKFSKLSRCVVTSGYHLTVYFVLFVKIHVHSFGELILKDRELGPTSCFGLYILNLLYLECGISGHLV